MTLSDLIQQEHFPSPAEEALLGVLVTANWITSELAQTMAPFGVSPPQYNVLRIVRGRQPERPTCSDIKARLLDRTPDVTRLVSRLQDAGLVERHRSEEDRRAVEVALTPEGQDLLRRLDPLVEATIDRLMQHLSPEEQAALSGLLERTRTDQT
jgi:DNA-binding MarR family transcriptional regulator